MKCATLSIILFVCEVLIRLPADIYCCGQTISESTSKFEQSLRFLRLKDNKKKDLNVTKLFLPQSVETSVDTPTKAHKQTVTFRRIFEKLLEVRCDEERLIVLLHYEQKYSLLAANLIEDVKLNGHFFVDIGTDSDNRAWKRFEAKIDEACGCLLLTIPYQDCNHVQLKKDANVVGQNVTIEFENQTSSEHLRSVHETYEVFCQIDVDISSIISTQRLQLFDKPRGLEVLDFPKTVVKDTKLYILGSANISDDLIFDVDLFLVDCWVTHLSYDSHKPSQKFFLQNGCPSEEGGRGLATVYHSKRTRIKFEIGDELLLSKRQLAINVQCLVLPCVKSFTIGAVDLPKCPIVHYCSGEPLVTHRLPEYLENCTQYEVSVGPLKIVEKKGPTPKTLVQQSRKADRLILVPSKICRCSNNSLANNLTSSIPNTLDTAYSFKVETTVAVGLLSCLIGFLTVAVIWMSQTAFGKFLKRQRLV